MAENININETIQVSESWIIKTNPRQIHLDESVQMSDAWTLREVEQVDYASKILSVNPLIIVTNTNPAKIVEVDITDPTTPIWTVTDLIGVANAEDITYDSTTEYFYITCANGKVVKADKNNLTSQTIIDLSDTDNLLYINHLNNNGLIYVSTNNTIGELYLLDERAITSLNTDLKYLSQIDTILETDFNYINAELIDTNLEYLAFIETNLNTNFEYLTDNVENLTPIARNDFHVYIDDIELGNSDLVLSSIRIRHTIGEDSFATFRLARHHDAINTTLTGSTINITSQNNVKVYIDNNLEFTGKISELNMIYAKSNEYIDVTCYGTQQTTSINNITLSLPGLTENRNLYHIINMSNIQINNPDIDVDDENPTYYKGIQVDLGEKITQNIQRWSYFGNTTTLAENVENGVFKPKQNWTYFWLAKFRNFVTNSESAILRYLGTTLGSLSGDTWNLTGASYKRQRQYDDTTEELGTYEVGQAPYKSISTRNGIKNTKIKWEDKSDGLYETKEESYNYENYAKQVADLEYEKLKTINDEILPVTSANIEIMIDSYYYNKIRLLSRINIDNTTEAGIYLNNNGFPVSVKAIDINALNMTVVLTNDNTKSIVELEEIDDQYPDEESDEFIQAEESVKTHTKYDPNIMNEIE